MDDEKTAAPSLGEIATSGARDITAGYIDVLLQQPRDSVLQTRGGGDWLVYQDILRDDQVKSTFQQRQLAVVSREWTVDAGGDSPLDKAAAEFIEEQLGGISFDDVTGKMLYGVYYGFAVAECNWTRDGRRIVFDSVKVKNRRRFRWDNDGRLRLLTRDHPNGEILPPHKFWTFAAGADNDDDPYGLGLGHWLYWPVFFKRNDIRFWLIFLEKFGQPTAVGKHPSGASADDRSKLLAATAAVATEAAIIMPEGMMIELLEATRSGTADYKAMHEVMNAAIAKVVLSQTMTTEDGSSQSQAEVHMDVRQEVVKADSDLVCGSFNAGPVTWLTEWNFPGAKPPRIWRRVEDEPDLKILAERDEILSRIGYRPTPEHVKETYGEDYQDVGRPPETARSQGAAAADPAEDPDADPDAGPAAFAEADQDGPTDPALARDLLTDRMSAETETVLAGMVDAVRQALSGAGSYEEASAALLAFEADGHDLAAFADAMAEGFAVAELAGRSDVADEIEADDA